MRKLVRGLLQRREVAVFFLVGVSSWFFMFFMGGGADVKTNERWGEDTGPYPNALADNIFWFVQVTDIHLTYLDDMRVAEPLLEFCRDTVKMVRPSLVLVTGDLTHAKYPGERHSKQFVSEWEQYRKVLQKCDLGSVPWLDIRGNHDSFDVPSFSDPANYFTKYSSIGKNHSSKSYSYLHRTKFGDYNFIAMDACPSPGPRRPFNFFGVLHEEDLQFLKNLSLARANHTVWFSHYPSAIISTQHRDLKQLMASSVAHVCGHLHTLRGLMHRMYGRHPGGHLELELGDYTGTRRFRLMAIDHDLFSFVDIGTGKWPYILVTNPKDARFLSREPTKRMLLSSHVRILIFSPHKIVSVKLSIDGNFHSSPQPVEGGPLYISPWQPTQYAHGLHEMLVEVQDASGVSRSYHQPFSLDNTLASLDLLPQLLLLSDMQSVFRWLFLLTWLSLLICLASSWASIGGRWFLMNLVQTKHLFYPYIATVVYLGIGPWYVGEMLTGRYGFVWMHGVYVMGTFIPGSMTYFHGVIRIVGVYIPLGIFLHVLLSSRTTTGSCGCGSLWRGCCCYGLMLCSVLLHCVDVFSITYPYGPLAMILSPGGTWAVLLNLVLLYLAYSRTRRRNVSPAS